MNYYAVVFLVRQGSFGHRRQKKNRNFCPWKAREILGRCDDYSNTVKHRKFHTSGVCLREDKNSGVRTKFGQQFGFSEFTSLGCSSHEFTGRQNGGFVKGWFWRMCPRSGFVPGGMRTCERTLVPVFVQGENPNVPSFRFSFRGSIRQNHSFGKPPFCQPVMNEGFVGATQYCCCDTPCRAILLQEGLEAPHKGAVPPLSEVPPVLLGTFLIP